MPSALPGLRVLDFSRVLAGPLATMTLGDLGADVLKVERPGTGDDTRAWGPPHDAAGAATYFQAVNRNKRSVALDLRSSEGRDAARRLAAGADVLVENFRPGVMARLGLDHPALAAENPRLVYCSITGFGTGEGAALPGYDLLVQAVGGLMSVTGAPEGEPQKVGVALVDVVCGLQATVGILAALQHRAATGEGQRVQVDLLSSLLSGLVNQASGYTVAGAVPQRMGNAHPSIAPYELFDAEDGSLVLAVGNDKQFEALCAAVGLEADPRFATNADRVAHRAELREALEARLASQPVEAWTAQLAAAGVPAGAVNDVAGAFALAERLGLAPVQEAGGVPLPRSPIGLSATPATARRAPPALGADAPRWLDEG